MSETLFDLIAGIIAVVFFSCITIICIVREKELKENPKIETKQCTNIKKFYKDDILFDNFYIACDEPINLEIGPELYTRIIEGKNYKIEYKNGMFNRILKDF